MQCSPIASTGSCVRIKAKVSTDSVLFFPLLVQILAFVLLLCCTLLLPRADATQSSPAQPELGYNVVTGSVGNDGQCYCRCPVSELVDMDISGM
jgi:hypothetical protein